MMSDRSETHLCELVHDLIEPQCQAIESEAQLGRCRADLLATRDGDFHAIPAKASFNMNLFAQAEDHAKHAHYVTIAVWYADSHEFKAGRNICRAMGYGLISAVPGEGARWEVQPRRRDLRGAQLDQARGGMAEAAGSSNRAGMKSPRTTTERSEIVKVSRGILEGEGGRMSAKQLHREVRAEMGQSAARVRNAIERDQHSGIVYEGRTGEQDAVLVD